MPDTLPGFLIAAGLALFVFSLFEGSITYNDTNLPSLGKKGRITLMILGPSLMILGGFVYYYSGPLVMDTPPPKLVNTSGEFKRVVSTPECKAAPYTEIMSNQTLLIGLESTTIKTQHASLIIVDNTNNTKSKLSISKNQSGTYKHDSHIINIKIKSVSECAAKYEIHTI